MQTIIQDHLEFLAKAMLEAHENNGEFMPPPKHRHRRDDVLHRFPCQCEACRLARILLEPEP